MTRIEKGRTTERDGEPAESPSAPPAAASADSDHSDAPPHPCFTDLLSRPPDGEGDAEPEQQTKADTEAGGPQTSEDLQDAASSPRVRAASPHPQEPHTAPAGPGPDGSDARRPGPAESEFGGAARTSDRAASNDPQSEARRLAEGAAVSGLATPAPHRLEAFFPAEQAAPKEASATDIIAELADRILVAEPAGGRDEIRIKLNIDTLQGAEITVRRDAEGLSVTIDTPSPDIADRLSEARGQLAERLRDKTGLEVSIEIPMPNGREAGGDGGDGRSRNRLGYIPESGDDA